MAKVQWQFTMSLDGFIAGPGGDMSWLAGYGGPNAVVDGVVASVGALLVGNRTFGGDDPNRGTDAEGPYGGRWTGPQFVLTHNPPERPVPGVTFVGDLTTALDAAMAAAGDRYVSVLGADVARQCIEADALDEVLVFVAPVLLGDGVRVFDRVGGDYVRLDCWSIAYTPPVTAQWFRVRR
jgi:dihydrofolate reductase